MQCIFIVLKKSKKKVSYDN